VEVIPVASSEPLAADPSLRRSVVAASPEMSPEAPRPDSQLGEAASTKGATVRAGEAPGKEPMPAAETPAVEVTPAKEGSTKQVGRVKEVVVILARFHREYLLAIVVSDKAAAMEDAIEEGARASHLR
jgi:hypothetical protein